MVASTVTLAQAVELAAAAYQHGDWPEAERLCRLMLEAHPHYFDALYLLGIIAAQTGRTAEAAALLMQAVALDAAHADARNNLGVVLRALRRYPEALDSYERAIALEPAVAEPYANRGNALQDLKRYDAALTSQKRALALAPAYAEAWINRGNVLRDLRRLDDALASYERALALAPQHAGAHSKCGVVLTELKRYPEALASCECAIALAPDGADVYGHRGNVLREMRRYDAALASCGRALALDREFAEVHSAHGNALRDLRRDDEARVSFERSIALAPDHADAYVNCGNVLLDLRRQLEALERLQRALQIRPDYDYLYGAWLHTKQGICDWRGIESDLLHLTAQIGRGVKAANPFAVVTAIDSPGLQRTAADILAQDRYPPDDALPALLRYPRRAKISIGYYSADFHDHATSYLMAGLFEAHDRSRFEIIGFSFGAETQGPMRQRLSAAIDEFMDVRALSDQEVAKLSRERAIDIAVDLKGYTQHGRPGIFAERAAPIQVNYLGYPGTMAAPYMDYLIADPVLIPEESRWHYAEKIVYLPHSYQVNDSQRVIAEVAFRREQLGLPPTGFVYCCFNNDYKIAPAVFDSWMRILDSVEGSVLWLLEDNAGAAFNLRREAELRGIAGGRLVFAGRMTQAEHLARHRLADLFLDTLPCNAHTTASDALWAGLPVLTCVGQSFAARVAASLLNAISLPELIVSTAQQYVARAIELATHPRRLQDIRTKLAANRLTAPLFDTRLYAQHIEAAYAQIYERYHAGLPPDHIHVAA